MATKKKAPAKVVTDATIDQEARAIGEVLKAQEKVALMIAPDEKEPTWRGCINGYDFAFPKGQLIEVPKSVAMLIEQSAHVAYQKQQLEEKLVKGLGN